MNDGNGRCGEYLVRTASKDGVVSSNALHFWYFGITEDLERKALAIIEAVKTADKLPDDPPLKSGT